MHIRYSKGRVLEGIILSFTPDMARIALKGSDDAAEFQLVAGRWISEDWEPVVFDFAPAPVLGTAGRGAAVAEPLPWLEAGLEPAFETAGEPLEPQYVN